MSCGSSASCRLLLLASVSNTCRPMCLWLYSVPFSQSSFRTRLGDWQLPSLPSGTWSVLFCTYIQYYVYYPHTWSMVPQIYNSRKVEARRFSYDLCIRGDDRLLECGWLLCLKGNSCSPYWETYGVGCCESSLLTESRGFAQPMKLGFPHRIPLMHYALLPSV